MSQTDPYSEVHDLLVSTIRALIEKQDEVTVFIDSSQPTLTYRVRVADTDLGSLIGERGKTERAIRMLLSLAANKRNLRVGITFEVSAVSPQMSPVTRQHDSEQPSHS